MRKVFSYVRFSTKEQAKGDSLRRQKEMGEAWVARHASEGFVLDESLKLDKGTSAYTGKNLRESNPLGGFIARVKAGKIPRGSVLMLENLDRFSRQPVRRVYGLFCSIVEHGIDVLTLKPEQMITMANIDKMEVVMPVIISMQLGFEESAKKGERISAAQTKKKQSIRDGGPVGQDRKGGNGAPAWLLWSKTKQRYLEKPEVVKAIQYAFKRLVEAGMHIAVKELNQGDAVDWSPRTGWSKSYIQSLLRTRSVLGEYAPHKIVIDETTRQRTRVPDGPPITGFYPRIIDDKLYYAAIAAVGKRCRRPGRVSKTEPFVNLFAGLAKMVDGQLGYIVTTMRPDGTRLRRFMSKGHTKCLPDSCSVGINYDLVERAVVGLLRDLKPNALSPKCGASERQIEKRVKTLAGMDARLLELRKALTSDPTKAVADLQDAIAKLQAQRDAEQREIDNLSIQKATVDMQPVEEFQSVLDFIHAKPKKDHYELRLRLQSLIGAMVEEIILDPHMMPNRRCTADMCVKLRNGRTCWRYNIAEEVPEEVMTMIDAGEDAGDTKSFVVSPTTDGGFSTFKWPKTMDAIRDRTAKFPEPKHHTGPMVKPTAKAKPSLEKKGTAKKPAAKKAKAASKKTAKRKARK